MSQLHFQALVRHFLIYRSNFLSTDVLILLLIVDNFHNIKLGAEYCCEKGSNLFLDIVLHSIVEILTQLKQQQKDINFDL